MQHPSPGALRVAVKPGQRLRASRSFTLYRFIAIKAMYAATKSEQKKQLPRMRSGCHYNRREATNCALSLDRKSTNSTITIGRHIKSVWMLIPFICWLLCKRNAGSVLLRILYDDVVAACVNLAKIAQWKHYEPHKRTQADRAKTYC